MDHIDGDDPDENHEKLYVPKSLCNKGITTHDSKNKLSIAKIHRESGKDINTWNIGLGLQDYLEIENYIEQFDRL